MTSTHLWATRVPPASVVLRNGTVVHVDAGRPADEAEIAELVARIDEPHAPLFEAVARRSARFEHASSSGALTARADGQLVGCGAYVADDGGGADVACVVDPAFRGLGLGTHLLRGLADAAADADVELFRIELHPGSTPAAEMLRDCGLRIHWDLDYPVARVVLRLGERRPGRTTPQT